MIAARERRVLPGGEPMQPQDVADEMNRFLWAQYQADKTLPRPTTLDHRFVLAYEAGRHRWPSEHYRAAFRHALGVSADADLGFTPKRRRRNSRKHVSEQSLNEAASLGSAAAVFPEVAETGTVRDVLPLVGLSAAREAPRAATTFARPPDGDGAEGQLSDVAWEAMKRRSLIAWAAAAVASGGTSAGFGSPTSRLGLETARQSLLLTAAYNRPGVSVDEWNEIVLDYGYDYLVESPAEILQRLNVDVVSLQLVQADANSDAERKELSRAGAMLAAFTAKTTSNMGSVHVARRWWRAANRIADESGDLSTILWVRGQEIIRALYDRRDITRVLELVERTEDYAAVAEAAMLPSFLSGKAQALAAAGRPVEARAALQRLEEVYSSLPHGITTVRSRESDLKWPLSKYLFTASYVHSHGGALPEAQEAQDLALRQYLPGHVRAPVQIKLHRALCMVAAGDIGGGLAYAKTTVSELPQSHYIRPVIDGAHSVLAAAPVDQQSSSEYGELADLLSGRPAIEA